jgi:hypothetical protein
MEKLLLERSKTEGSIYDNIAKRFSLRKMPGQITGTIIGVKEKKSSS